MMSILIIMQLPQVHDRLGNDIARRGAIFALIRTQTHARTHINVQHMLLFVLRCAS